MKKIAIFASGTGSNAKKIIEYFKDQPKVGVDLVVSNRSKAPVLQMAEDLGIDHLVISREQLYDSDQVAEVLKDRSIDLIVLAGFLWLIPQNLVNAFPNRIINIHPALLPKYGGKGMYGTHVHKAVKEAGDSKSGITIHYVNKNYDEGQTIFQASCPINREDSPEEIAAKVLKLEHQYFAPVIEKLLLDGN